MTLPQPGVMKDRLPALSCHPSDSQPALNKDDTWQLTRVVTGEDTHAYVGEGGMEKGGWDVMSEKERQQNNKGEVSASESKNVKQKGVKDELCDAFSGAILWSCDATIDWNVTGGKLELIWSKPNISLNQNPLFWTKFRNVTFPRIYLYGTALWSFHLNSTTSAFTPIIIFVTRSCKIKSEEKLFVRVIS